MNDGGGLINRILILGISALAILASDDAHAAVASWPVVCEPDDVSHRSVDSDLASTTFLISLDTTSNPLKVRIEPRGSKHLPLIDVPMTAQYRGPNGTWIVNGVQIDPGLGTAMGEPIIYSFTITLGERPGAVEVERGIVRYRLGPTDLLTKFVFECHRQDRQ